MSGELTKSPGTIIDLFHGLGGNTSVPKPFERDIFLFDTFVAGTGFVVGIEELESHMSVGDKLEFYREPNNPYDERAIVVRTIAGAKIGYVPKAGNLIFSRLMDAGKLLFARIVSKYPNEGWPEIEIKVFLHDE
ncbi:MAG: HIRAN domain-containing protein [Treponema sp.]|nr:HIRAN domain-containing protein [Treponema sp.]